MLSIDLNCDMGESYGAWRMGNDSEIMPFVSSVNIACGFHAGDPGVMRATVESALEHNVAIGAHPSYPDIQGFGRREMGLTTEEIKDSVCYQIGALEGICRSSGGRLNHVKPHGALYNRSARDESVARAIAEAVRSFDSSLTLFGLSGSESIKAGEDAGLSTASEVFSDRTYTANGSLTPRTEDNALLTEVNDSIRQITAMIANGIVIATDGTEVALKAETICIHGDGEHAVDFAREIRLSLDARNIEVRPV